jgi:NAD(P)H dehydrogenase (quinone)
MSTIVTATSGHLGRLVVRDLLERGVPATDIVAGARDLDAITDLAETGVRTALIDYNDPATIEAAANAGDTFVLVSSNDLANKDRQHADAIAAAARAGAGPLIYTSGLRAAETDFAIAASHAATEDVVRASGLPFTILRNGWYTENYERDLPAVRGSGILLASVGEGRVASASRADFAAAAGVVAAGPEQHAGATYELSGDVAWTYTDLADALSEVLGRDVTYRPVTTEQHTEILKGAGVPEQFATMMAAVDAGLGAGGMAYQNGDLARLIGRPTIPLVDGLRPLV